MYLMSLRGGIAPRMGPTRRRAVKPSARAGVGRRRPIRGPAIANDSPKTTNLCNKHAEHREKGDSEEGEKEEQGGRERGAHAAAFTRCGPTGCRCRCTTPLETTSTNPYLSVVVPPPKLPQQLRHTMCTDLSFLKIVVVLPVVLVVVVVGTPVHMYW